MKPFFVVVIGCLVIACKEKTVYNSASQLVIVKDSVNAMAKAIAKNVSKNGPIEWLKVFDNSPDFFMANDGQLAFANYDAAKTFVNNILVKNIIKITLQWDNIRIEPLTANLASLAADYKENVTDKAGKTTVYNGFFTSLAKQTSQGWKLHNVHWSSMLNK